MTEDTGFVNRVEFDEERNGFFVPTDIMNSLVSLLEALEDVEIPQANSKFSAFSKDRYCCLFGSPQQWMITPVGEIPKPSSKEVCWFGLKLKPMLAAQLML